MYSTCNRFFLAIDVFGTTRLAEDVGRSKLRFSCPCDQEASPRHDPRLPRFTPHWTQQLAVANSYPGARTRPPIQTYGTLRVAHVKNNQ